MSVDPKFGRYCDGCGRAIVNAVRIHRGKDYCRSCYQSNFVRAPCAVCQRSMRHHRHSTGEQVCDVCVRSTRTCLRCGRLTPIAGKLVGQSAVCNACAPYFRERRPCTSCGCLSSRLSRPAGLKNPICEPCRRRITHASCATCRRYRVVARWTDDDRPKCKDCAPEQQVTHPCPVCGAVVLGGGARRCRGCTNRTAISQHATLVAAGLEGEWSRILWGVFVAEQLSADPDNPRLKQKIEHSAEFFEQLDQRFEALSAVTTESMTGCFDSRFLRKHLLASRFVTEQLDLQDFAACRNSEAERRRYADILARAKNEKYGTLLAAYAEHLAEKRVAMRTARLYLRAAEAFCAHADVGPAAPWREERIIGYLRSAPGQGASLARFVTYCAKELGWDVRVPHKQLWKSASTTMATQVKELRKALRETDNVPSSALTTREVARVLSIALGVPAAQLLRDRDAGKVLVHETGGIEVTDQAILLPADPLHRYAQRWADLASRNRSKRG